MTQRYWLSIYILTYLFVIQQIPVECHRRFQRIIINGHDWVVPNEPVWDAFLREAEPIHKHLLSKCTSTRECRLAAEELRQLFIRNQMLSKYNNGYTGNGQSENDISSIFKWG